MSGEEGRKVEEIREKEGESALPLSYTTVLRRMRSQLVFDFFI